MREEETREEKKEKKEEPFTPGPLGSDELFISRVCSEAATKKAWRQGLGIEDGARAAEQGSPERDESIFVS